MGYRSEPGGGETRKAARLAECCYEGYHPAGGAKTGNHQKKLVAYFRHTFSSILKANGEDVKSSAGAIPAYHVPHDPGHLHPSAEPGQAGGSEQGGEHDQPETKLYRRCTAKF